MMREGPLQGGPESPAETRHQPGPPFAAQLWEAFPAAYRAARHLANDPAAAEALLLASIRLARHEQALRPPGTRFTTWLLRLVARAARASLPETSGDPAAAPLSGTVPASTADETRALPAGWGRPPGAAVAALASADLSSAVGALPPQERAAVAFFVAEELTTDELGLILGVAPEVARSRLCRGRRLLSAAIRQGAPGWTVV